MNVISFEKNAFYNPENEVIAITHSIDTANQKMVLVNKTLFLEKLAENDLELVWLVDHYKAQNTQHPKNEDKHYPTSCRKYYATINNGEISWVKIWQERFSNMRDKHLQKAWVR